MFRTIHTERPRLRLRLFPFMFGTHLVAGADTGAITDANADVQCEWILSLVYFTYLDDRC